MKAATIVGIALLLCACQREPVPGVSSGAGAGATLSCAVTPEVQALLGKAATPALVAEAQRLSGARAVRRVEPNSAVTMDYRVDRLNVHVDAQGSVERVDCG